jgi:predicted nucleic acid-binding protein
LIFLDTGFLFALFVEGDDHHDRVRQVFEGFPGSASRTFSSRQTTSSRKR